jgi:hypothetical protein
MTTPSNQDHRARDLFHIGDHIEVTYPNSKHHGRTGIITLVNDPRLSVSFDDRRPGSYVDYKYVRLLSPRTPVTTDYPRLSRTPRVDEDFVTVIPHDNREENEDATIVLLMENLAIQTATGALATSNDMADVERAINDQANRIRTQARSILRRRSRNNTP